MRKIKTAIIGVGSLGQHHARILAKHPDSELVAIVDSDLKRSEKLAKTYNTSAFADINGLAGKAEAAVIAVPTPAHYQIARALLNAGIHCLVEKPFTSTVEEAEELIEISIKQNLVLQVGHIERFNPAVVAAMPYIKSPKFVEVNRLGPYDPRTSHIGVILDLMIHDLDMVTALVNDRIVSIEAHGAKVLSDHEDIAKVRIKFAGGCVADLSASRVSLDKYRKIRIFQPDCYISVDYAGKSLKVYRKKAGAEKVSSLLDIDVIKPKIKEEEPLYLELDHFLSCVSEGKPPLVSGQHGRNALELALEIRKNLTL